MYDSVSDGMGSVHKLYFIGIVIILLVSVASVFEQVKSVGSFRQHVNMTIERSGGLTKTAMESINSESEQSYNGRFSVNSDKLGEKVTFGEIVEYQIEGEIKVAFFDLPDRVIDWSGSAVSQVR